MASNTCATVAMVLATHVPSARRWPGGQIRLADAACSVAHSVGDIGSLPCGHCRPCGTIAVTCSQIRMPVQAFALAASASEKPIADFASDSGARLSGPKPLAGGGDDAAP